MNHKICKTIPFDAPKWAGLVDYMKREAFKCGLEYHLEHNKGFIFETGKITIRGSIEQCNQFERNLAKAVHNYNTR